MAMNNTRNYFSAKKCHTQIYFADSKEDALHGADALIIATEWAEFKSPDFAFIKQELNTPVIFDGRNILNLDIAQDYGVMVFGIGRGEDSAYESQKNIINKIKNLEGV